MEANELDILLEDLETRVERLRSLYEQYFLGIEKIPPHVAQKDVDRRLYALRRQQIRNTARRFKLQTIIQRYNTFQQYWMRIMREIENGTYRRHVLRAERTVGITDHLTAAERKRLALPERESQTSSASEMPVTPSDSEDLDDSSLVATNPAPPSPPGDKAPRDASPSLDSKDSPRAVRAQIERDLGLLLDEDLDELDTHGLAGVGSELDDPLLSSMPPPLRRKASAKPIARRSSRPGLERRHVRTPRPTNAVSVEQPPASQNDVPPSNAISPAKRFSARPSRPQSAPTSAVAQGGLRLPAFSAVAGRGLPPKTVAPRGAPAKTGIPPINKTTERAPVTGGIARVTAGAVPVPSTSGNNQPTAVQPKTPPEPEIPASAVGGRPSPPVRPDRNQPADRDKPSEGLEHAKVERLAEKLRNARQQTNENSPVSVDALAKKLEVTAAQLREKHQGRQIDFDVVIKDGRAIVKPIIR
ncbi:MAG: MXAN_5187 C-terminal domain-containing protein [Myxococcales bacterium]